MKPLKITMIALGFASAGYAFSSPFEIVVTETTPGSNPNPGSWLGIQRYGFSDVGASPMSLTGIAASQLSDPAGLYFDGGELFVGNRHGNSNPSSVSRFTFDFFTDAFTANGSITGNGLFGVHGIAKRNGFDELYASNVNTGISAFGVTPSSSSSMGTLLSGPFRDVFFSGDGMIMYATQGVTGNLIRYNFSDSSSTSYNIAGTSGLHNGNWRGDHLFVSDFGSNKVMDIAFDANGAVVSSTVAATVSGAIGVCFSPDQTEMFVSSHTGNSITRFLYNSGTSAWDFESVINTGVAMGDIETIAPVPEPASLAVLGLGALALLRRRKK